MTELDGGSDTPVRRIGIVVHPERELDGPLGRLRSWAQRNDVEIVQVPVRGQDRRVAAFGDGADCQLMVSIGGDGTMLAAIRAAMAHELPTLGIACGSLGALTSVVPEDLDEALDRYCRGDWKPRRLPALAVKIAGQDNRYLAVNDLAITRGGPGQVRVTSLLDGILFSRIAGDGCIVSTPLGSSAYALAAGGPLLTPGTRAYLLTPLATHGGFRQPLVIAADSTLALEISAGIGGVRLEIDGQLADGAPQALTVTWKPDVATLVSFDDAEPLLVSLRRRQIIVDSPRLLGEAQQHDQRPITGGR
jgi:NAD+ kinase